MANPILQLLEALRNMFTCDIGIDLGTANTLVYMKGRGIIIREPSVVAVDARTDELRVRCVGHEAKAIIGAAPNSILAVRPLKDGVIADFDITAAMLQSFIRQACGSRLFVRPRVVICVPSGVTEVERRAVRQAAAKAGARQVTVIEEPMAAAAKPQQTKAAAAKASTSHTKQRTGPLPKARVAPSRTAPSSRPAPRQSCTSPSTAHNGGDGTINAAGGPAAHRPVFCSAGSRYTANIRSARRYALPPCEPKAR